MLRALCQIGDITVEETGSITEHQSPHPVRPCEVTTELTVSVMADAPHCGPTLLSPRQEDSQSDSQSEDAPVRCGPFDRKMLTYAVTWGRLDLLDVLLANIGTAAGQTPELASALMVALELGQEELAQQILSLPHVNFEMIDMFTLYTAFVDKFEYSYARTQLKRQLSEGRVDVLLHRAATSSLTPTLFKRPPIKVVSRDTSSGSMVSTPELSHRVYQKCLGDYLDIVTSTPAAGNLLNRGDRVQADDCFLWAIGSGRMKLAVSFLPRCRQPVHLMLIGARLSQSMARSLTRKQGSWSDSARFLEQMALDELGDLEKHAAHAVLRTPPAGSDQGTLVHLAIGYRLKDFLSQGHCVDIMDIW